MPGIRAGNIVEGQLMGSFNASARQIEDRKIPDDAGSDFQSVSSNRGGLAPF